MRDTEKKEEERGQAQMAERHGKRKARLRISENYSRTAGNIWECWREQGDETGREQMNNVGSRFSSQGFIPGFRI